jgi:hypothetical protein
LKIEILTQYSVETFMYFLFCVVVFPDQFDDDEEKKVYNYRKLGVYFAQE